MSRGRVAAAIDSSRCVSAASRVLAGSAIAAGLRAGARFDRQLHQWITGAFGEGWTLERETRAIAWWRVLAGESRIFRLIERQIDRAPAAWNGARAGRLLTTPVLACVLLVAVLTHVVSLAAVGVPVSAVGWMFRGSLAAAALLAIAVTWWRTPGER